MKFIGILAVVFVQVALCNCYYLITSPNAYEPNKDVNISVQFFGEKSCNVRIDLFSRVWSGEKKNMSTTEGFFSPGKIGYLLLKVPDFKSRTNLYIQGTVCGSKTETRRVQNKYWARKSNQIFIQTDKPIYKPGQKVRMRIVSMGTDLKPFGNMVSEVTIEDVNRSRIMQWKDVKLEDGIASLELQLSKQPVIGTWEIEAKVAGEKGSQEFEVKKYVLPKFEVVIRPPPYMATDQKEYTTKICAKYTYGKRVEGKLTAEFCMGYTRRNSYRLPRNKRRHSTCHYIIKELQNGCADVTLTRNELAISNVTYLWSAEFKINANVTEKQTGVTLNGLRIVKGLESRSYKLSFEGTPRKFKPGLPFRYQLKVSTQDDKPATGLTVRVTIGRNYNDRSVFYNKTFKVNNGLIKEMLTTLAYTTDSVIFQARLLNRHPYPRNRYEGTTRTYFTADAWYSPSLSYILLSKSTTEPAKIGSHASVKVTYTVRNDTGNKTDFYYNVYCKGNLVRSGVHTQYHPYVKEIKLVKMTVTTVNVTKADITNTSSSINATTNETISRIIPSYRSITWVPPPKIKLPKRSKPRIEQFEIKFPVTHEMVPLCRVLVYYVRKDYETVADGLKYDVEDVFKNKVKVSFVDKEKKPGKKTKLVLEAEPGSRVAIVAVDKSVHLLSSGNEITRDEVLPLLTRQDTGRSWNRNPNCHSYGRYDRSIVPYWGWGGNAEDASEAFNTAGVTFLSNLTIFTKPCPRPYPVLPRGRSGGWSSMGGGRMGGGRMGVGQPDPVAEVARRGDDSNEKETKKRKQKVRVRKDFPETWLWTDEKIDATGKKTIEVKVPDTITTWVANGFGMSSTVGFGVSDTAEIKGFQPLFVQLTLPYSVVRGEEIPIVVTVFNYMRRCMPIKLELNKDSADYNVTSYNIREKCVCGDTGESFKVNIIPIKLGKIDLAAEASISSTIMADCAAFSGVLIPGDKVIKKLLVEPEGITQEYTKSTFLCPKGVEKTEVFDLGLPNNTIPGSVYPTVSVIGDVMGAAMSNLDGLLRMPYGCGEQNMAKFAPNIYVMDYLTKTGQVTNELKSKAEGYMSSGYQRELTYKRKNGSYSAFGNSDQKGSLMLTAFVVRSFARAEKYIFIDDEQIEDSIKWLRGKQLTSGCFQSYGRLFNKGLQGGVNSELTITAYVTIALLETEMSTSDAMISEALSCIAKRSKLTNDTYAIALSTYSLVLANHPEKTSMLKKLRSKAIVDDGQKHWARTNRGVRPSPYYWYYRPPTADVEMTGYALLAIMKDNADRNMMSHSEPLQVVKWLSQQRNAYGGFSSTQDTCVALQALSEFAGAFFAPSGDLSSLELSVKIKDFSHAFSISKNNRLVLQRLELKPDLIPNKIDVKGKGDGCALVQASVKYNVPKPEEIPAFSVKVRVSRRSLPPDEEKTVCVPLKLDIEAKWLRPGASNMAVLDVKLPSGFSARTASLENLLIDLSLKCKRYDIDGKHVMIYFDEIGPKSVKFSFDIHQDEVVKKLKPAAARLYDYYEPDQEGTAVYEITEDMCYGDRIATECPKCMVIDKAKVIVDMVDCNTTVTRIKSETGKIKIGKRYTKNTKKGTKNTKRGTKLDYVIPEFCPCEGIYDNSKALMIGENTVDKDGAKMMMLDGRTRIVALKTRDMIRKVGKRMNKIMKKCKRK